MSYVLLCCGIWLIGRPVSVSLAAGHQAGNDIRTPEANPHRPALAADHCLAFTTQQPHLPYLTLAYLTGQACYRLALRPAVGPMHITKLRKSHTIYMRAGTVVLTK